MNSLKEELKRLSEHYSLCYMKLLIKRRYDWFDKDWNDTYGKRIELDILGKHTIYNQASHYGLEADIEWQLSTIYVKPYNFSYIHFVYEQVIIVRRPLGKLLEMKLPKAPLSDDYQFRDYDLGDYAYHHGKLRHESRWEELSVEGFVDWVQGIEGNMIINTRKNGVVSECLQRYPVLHSVVEWHTHALCFHPHLMDYYCNEKEWNEYTVISIWRYYLGLKGIIIKKEDWSLLWEKYTEIVEWLEENHVWFRDNGIYVYERSIEYVTKARELVLKYPYLLNPLVSVNMYD